MKRTLNIANQRTSVLIFSTSLVALLLFSNNKVLIGSIAYNINWASRKKGLYSSLRWKIEYHVMHVRARHLDHETRGSVGTIPSRARFWRWESGATRPSIADRTLFHSLFSHQLCLDNAGSEASRDLPLILGDEDHDFEDAETINLRTNPARHLCLELLTDWSSNPKLTEKEPNNKRNGMMPCKTMS